MDSIIHFFETLPALQKTLWYIAIPSTVVFLIMMVLTFMGLDGTDGLDTDIDTDVDDASDAFQVWTFRNLVIFMSVFSWSALSFLDFKFTFLSSSIYSAIIGVTVVFLLSGLFYFMHKLQQDNTPKISDILNKNAMIYLTVPARGSGMGKINVNYGGALREVNAISNSRSFKTGEQVKVINLQGDLALIDEINN